MKPCPFCGGESEFYRGKWESLNSGYPDTDYYCVECKKCRSRSATVPIMYFCDFSDFRVDDFRKNPALRASEEDKYENYLTGKREEAISKWDKRSAEV